MYGSGYHKFEITKREILVSISIVALLLIIGIVISNKIYALQTDKTETYNKAVKINTSEMFQYGMSTNVGNAFVYGELKAIDYVTYPEIHGQYLYIEKQREEYTQHTRINTYTDENGNTYTQEEIYYTWDYVCTESLKCTQISFCGVVFDSNKISTPVAEYIDTLDITSRIRYKYYGVVAKQKGTIFTELRDNTISDQSEFFVGTDIDATLKQIATKQKTQVIIFWVLWIGLTGILVYMFYYAENRWLE